MPPPPATWAPPPTAWCTWVVYSVLNLCSLLSLTVINKGVSFFYISVSVYYVVLYTNWWKLMESHQTKNWEVGVQNCKSPDGKLQNLTFAQLLVNWVAETKHWLKLLEDYEKTQMHVAPRIVVHCCPLLTICPRCCPRHGPRWCPRWCPRHAPDMPQTCPRHDPVIPQTCPRHAQVDGQMTRMKRRCYWSLMRNSTKLKKRPKQSYLFSSFVVITYIR